LRRVHVQGQFGHSVELHQSIVENRGDIVQKYSSVTKQRGFQDAEAMQQRHVEQLQRRLDLPFPNPVPPAPARLLICGRRCAENHLEGIQYANTTRNRFKQATHPLFQVRVLYESFPSHDSTGQFPRQRSAVCCRREAMHAPRRRLDEADSSHLELVRELVKAAAASLNATSRLRRCGGPHACSTAAADVLRPARMNPSHMEYCSHPALSSLLAPACPQLRRPLPSRLRRRARAGRAHGRSTVHPCRWLWWM